MNEGNGPGCNHREGITAVQLTQEFPDEETVRVWIKRFMLPNGRACPRCKETDTHKSTHRTRPYRCRPSERFFGVPKGTHIENSRLLYLTWVPAIYLELTNLKGIYSMKLYRDIGVRSQRRGTCYSESVQHLEPSVPILTGPIEVDESYFGELEKNTHSSKKVNLVLDQFG